MSATDFENSKKVSRSGRIYPVTDIEDGEFFGPENNCDEGDKQKHRKNLDADELN
jgi:hypothetical protein